MGNKTEARAWNYWQRRAFISGEPHREKLCFRPGVPPPHSCPADVQQAPSDRLGRMSACVSIAVTAGSTIVTDGRVCSCSSVGQVGGRRRGREKFFFWRASSSRIASAERVMRNRPSALISSFNISPCQKRSLSS